MVHPTAVKSYVNNRIISMTDCWPTWLWLMLLYDKYSLDPFCVRVTLCSSGVPIMGSSLYKKKERKKSCPLLLFPSFSLSVLTTFHRISKIIVIMLTKHHPTWKAHWWEKKKGQRDSNRERQTDRQRQREEGRGEEGMGQEWEMATGNKGKEKFKNGSVGARTVFVLLTTISP